MTKRRQPARPRDVNQLAARIVALSIGEAEDTTSTVDPKRSKRGTARAEKLTPDERRKIAQKAAKARWKKQG